MFVHVLVKALEQQVKVLLYWVKICLLDKVTHVVDGEGTAIQLIDGSECFVVVQFDLIADALSNKFDADFAVDEALDEGLEKLTRGTFKVLREVLFTTIEATSRLE